MNAAIMNPQIPFHLPHQPSDLTLDRGHTYRDYRVIPPFTPGREQTGSSQQIVYPLPSPSAWSESTTLRHGAASNYEENLLRRKTPSGTIDGAYESNAHDVQATKHFLIPRNDSSQPFTHFTQLDSVLHQVPYRHMYPHQFYGQTVPSVLQPPAQYLGPTASGVDGRGPYGPYWNDGTYVPYRPAALRDPRYHQAQQTDNNQRADMRWSGGLGSGRMSSWQGKVPAPLAYPVVSDVGTVSWTSLTHGSPALPLPYASQASAGYVRSKLRVVRPLCFCELTVRQILFYL